MSLAERLGLEWPTPPVVSIVGAGSRQTLVEQGRTVERYGTRYDYGDDAISDLKFALRNEPLDLGLLSSTFRAMVPASLEAWVAAEPTGIYSRRAWFLYEFSTGRRLDLPDAQRVTYVPALDPARHLVLSPEASTRSRRHRVLDNLLGFSGLCPTVRLTPKLNELIVVPVADEARRLVEGADPVTLRRAIRYLYTKETRSSYEIEGEEVDESRAERFIQALETVGDFDATDQTAYVALQNLIVRDPRFHARGWRDVQSFIGSIAPGYRYKVHYVCPKSRDVPELMVGLGAMAERLRGSGFDPIVAAALVSFGFVFVHPFGDGNGRIHRYLIHHVMAEAGVAPPGVLFPVSATMLRNMAAYDAALESFSARVMPSIDWRWAGGVLGGEIEVVNDTRDLYRFFDATTVAEYLYERVIETVRKDLREELEFVEVYDRVNRALTEQLDGLPGPKVSLLALLCLQNGGRLAKGKRRLFAMLTEAEIGEAEELVRRVSAAMDAERAERTAEASDRRSA